MLTTKRDELSEGGENCVIQNSMRLQHRMTGHMDGIGIERGFGRQTG